MRFAYGALIAVAACSSFTLALPAAAGLSGAAAEQRADAAAGPAMPVLLAQASGTVIPSPPALPNAPGTVPTVPTTPGMPTEVPATPTVPGAHDLPKVPSRSDLPTMPDRSAMPSVPETPKMPTTPEMPKMPSVPGK